MHRRLSAFWVIVGVGLVVGCQPAEKTKTSSNKSGAADTHEHVHAPHGPHDGHLYKFDPHEYMLEIVVGDATDTFRAYVLAADGKQVQAVAADKIVVRSASGREPITFDVRAVAPDPSGAASEFSLDDANLLMHAKNFGVTVDLTVAGKTYKATVPVGSMEHDHHDHDHDDAAHDHDHEGEEHDHDAAEGGG
jgi:hypothetical protein